MRSIAGLTLLALALAVLVAPAVAVSDPPRTLALTGTATFHFPNVLASFLYGIEASLRMSSAA